MSKYNILPIFIPFQGCPRKCIFCDQNIISGTNIKDFKKDILEQFEFYKKLKDSWDEIAFYGGSFNYLSDDKRAFLYELTKQIDVKQVRISAYPKRFDKNFIKELQSNNVKTVELGIQSFSDDVLKKNRRFYTKDDVLNTITLLSKNGFNIGIQLMVGMYGESLEDILLNLNYLSNLKYKFLRIYPTVVLKSTHLAKLLKEKFSLNFTFPEVLAISTIYLISAIKLGATVLRVGLHNQSKIEDNIVGGYFHPSFGDIVKTFAIYLYCKITTHKPKLFKNFPNYKGIIAKTWDIEYTNEVNFKSIADQVWGMYIENNRWFTERVIFKIAEEFWGKTYQR
ncbi:radical SAM protein [Deferribacter autotrophicus]|uniref:Radical SAM protein n=1 Tax=Deferribacter autotrophicus TaxID=500465 RepID=A0A5A8F3M7_9BACT|nr:radical SAM protein [Deferribacter autotrophicus]KAA0258804.1 radical SAM protein [Deferribacter autotrophicus]